MKKLILSIAAVSFSLLLVACNSETSYDDGYDKGYEQGYEEGYDAGFRQGYISNGSSSESNDDSVSVPATIPRFEPASGTILSGTEYYDSEIRVTASGTSSYVVKLKNAYGVDRLSFYVRAGETVTVGVPAESLYVYFASGDTWYGEENLFGEYTSYSKDDEMLDFSQYTWEYTLYPVFDGNFSETPIDASEFN